jgi:nucleoid DNA-binding protein
MADDPLTKSALASVAASRSPSIPAQVSRMGVELFLDLVADSLSGGRPVSLRGFGRLIPRFYQASPTKRLGLLFHPSQGLVARINSPEAQSAARAAAAAARPGGTDTEP